LAAEDGCDSHRPLVMCFRKTAQDSTLH
jgi:hypothetical protein